MTDRNAKWQLVRVLERRVFEPVLRMSTDDYSGSQRAKLREVQESRRAELERLRSYNSADEVVEMYRGDLSSQPAKRIHRDSRDLGLPTPRDCREEFEGLARQLGVRA